MPQKRGAEPALSLPLKCTRLDHLPLNLRGQESKVNLPGWLTHGFGSRGGDVALFRVYFPAEAAVGVTAGCSQQGCARGPAEQLSCARARLAVLAWGHRASVTATATQGTRLSPHTVLLTPTFHCPPSVQQKPSHSDLRCDYRVQKNFSALALLLIYSARAASALVGFLV